ncbi:hypothetical protein G7046_g2782 [Stylonectria norvegica]|nr:hypothetical protein G7046_g2782 [Stylonectria norvegica]
MGLIGGLIQDTVRSFSGPKGQGQPQSSGSGRYPQDNYGNDGYQQQQSAPQGRGGLLGLGIAGGGKIRERRNERQYRRAERGMVRADSRSNQGMRREGQQAYGSQSPQQQGRSPGGYSDGGRRRDNDNYNDNYNNNDYDDRDAMARRQEMYGYDGRDGRQQQQQQRQQQQPEQYNSRDGQQQAWDSYARDGRQQQQQQNNGYGNQQQANGYDQQQPQQADGYGRQPQIEGYPSQRAIEGPGARQEGYQQESFTAELPATSVVPNPRDAPPQYYSEPPRKS